MNPKQAAPIIASLPALAAAAPPLIIGGLVIGAIYLVLDSLFPVKQKQPEAAPVEASKEAWKPAETTAFRQIPAAIPVTKLTTAPVACLPRAVIPPPAVQLVPKASVPVPASAIEPVIKAAVQVPPPIKKKFVTREDLGAVFQHGARTLTRTQAVTALKKIGFGKTAAYAALTRDGRFAAWLKFAPDGIITWTDARKA